jgi:UDP-N-acetylmuramate dehydrogenase
MNVQENVSLAGHSTMRLGGNASYLSEASSPEEVQKLVQWAKQRSMPFMIIGHGSNIVWKDEGYKGLIVVNCIKGHDVLNEDEKSATIKANSGEKWDDIVAWAVEKGLSGIEFLSAIPGTVGAAPVQNIGAYGSELADCFIGLEAYDTEQDKFITISAAECNFSYRNSRFKANDRGRFIILSITLKLHKNNPTPPFYESLQNYLTSQAISIYTPQVIRDAVIAIRKVKLPDPSVVNNNGSFFTNPIIRNEKFEQLKQTFPDIKGWPAKDGQVKVSAGWLVEQVGFKGIHDEATGMATWPESALVVINEHARSTADLLTFKQKIVDAVRQKFGTTLEQEPELLP